MSGTKDDPEVIDYDNNDEEDENEEETGDREKQGQKQKFKEDNDDDDNFQSSEQKKFTMKPVKKNCLGRKKENKYLAKRQTSTQAAPE